MAEFHPIDVRYKGPSTSYRGSAVAQPSSVNVEPFSPIPVIKRKAAKTRSHVPTFNLTTSLLFWMFRKWGGFIAALTLYLMVTGFNPLTLFDLVGTL